MKRSGPLQRKSPLRRSGSLSRSSADSMKRTPLPQRSSKKKKRDDAWPEIRERVIERDGSCRGREMGGACAGGPHVHHVKRRSQGGGDELWNLVLLCAAHHDLVHSEIERAREVGLLV